MGKARQKGAHLNIAGPLATLVFAVTVLTCFGAVFAYGVYKARERQRDEPLAKRLTYFVELALEPEPVATSDEPPGEGRRRPWAIYALSGAALLALVAASTYYGHTGLRLVVDGAWDDRGPSAAP